MKAAAFRYHRADSLAEAGEMLTSLDNARLLSGGQSLMAMMNLRYVIVDHLIDLNPVSELAGISHHDDHFQVGAMTRQRCFLDDDAVAAHSPIFREALGYVGHLQTRNRGTVGGSLAHMDPAAELLGLAALTDADITLSGPNGSRQVAIAEFPQAYMNPDIKVDEILTAVRFNRWPAGHGWDFREFAQRHGDFAVVGVGCLLTLDAAGAIDRAAVVLIGVADGPLRLPAVEAMLLGMLPNADLFRAAGEAARHPEITGDALVTADYRRQLAAVMVRRSLTNAHQRAVQAMNQEHHHV